MLQKIGPQFKSCFDSIVKGLHSGIRDGSLTQAINTGAARLFQIKHFYFLHNVTPTCLPVPTLYYSVQFNVLNGNSVSWNIVDFIALSGP